MQSEYLRQEKANNEFVFWFNFLLRFLELLGAVFVVGMIMLAYIIFSPYVG